MYNTIITCSQLQQLDSAIHHVIIDCRYDMADPHAGSRAYRDSHIPGAIYMDLATDMSGPVSAHTGRHPLPSDAEIVALFSSCGIDTNTQVVIYDASSGAFAARLWWMLHYMGHGQAAVLDGGWQAWVRMGMPTEQRPNTNPERRFQGLPDPGRVVTLTDFPLHSLLVDSREPERYLGKLEPIDPVAGHIPGAVNFYWRQNIAEDGSFRARESILAALLPLYDGEAPESTVFYCGSGVTACHNLLSTCYAGLPLPKLYVGSWSEWCSDPRRPVATGSPVGV